MMAIAWGASLGGSRDRRVEFFCHLISFDSFQKTL